MIQEPTSQLAQSSPANDGELTEPRIPAQRVGTRRRERILQARQSGAFTISIDEYGFVTLRMAGQAALVLKPEEAFDLLDFLFECRNLLAARSAEIAERHSDTPEE